MFNLFEENDVALSPTTTTAEDDPRPEPEIFDVEGELADTVEDRFDDGEAEYKEELPEEDGEGAHLAPVGDAEPVKEEEDPMAAVRAAKDKSSEKTDKVDLEDLSEEEDVVMPVNPTTAANQQDSIIRAQDPELEGGEELDDSKLEGDEYKASEMMNFDFGTDIVMEEALMELDSDLSMLEEGFNDLDSMLELEEF